MGGGTATLPSQKVGGRATAGDMSGDVCGYESLINRCLLYLDISLMYTGEIFLSVGGTGN